MSNSRGATTAFASAFTRIVLAFAGTFHAAAHVHGLQESTRSNGAESVPAAAAAAACGAKLELCRVLVVLWHSSPKATKLAAPAVSIIARAPIPVAPVAVPLP
jgi:hypothetical protein